MPPGHLLVNLGDLMSIWTNDRWVSNPHRVVNPPDGDRYSAVLFVTPPFHLRIEALPTCVSPTAPGAHEPLVSGPYLLSRFDGTHSYRNALLEEHNRAAAGWRRTCHPGGDRTDFRRLRAGVSFGRSHVQYAAAEG